MRGYVIISVFCELNGWIEMFIHAINILNIGVISYASVLHGRTLSGVEVCRGLFKEKQGKVKSWRIAQMTHSMTQCVLIKIVDAL